MNFKGYRKNLIRKIINLPGWHTKRKIVVFDSDDWGSIALPSREVFNNLKNAGFNIAENPYLKYDSLASENDLSALFDLLTKFKDKNGNHPVITANTVVANPDFDKIRESGFKEYHYELFTESLKKYPKHANSFNLWKEGMSQKIFYPQFHAREHLNIAYWMSELQAGHLQIHLGFNNNFYILDRPTHPDIKYSCTSAFYPKTKSESKGITNIVKDGLHIFRDIFGFSSDAFTGTGYIWESSLEKTLSEEGVKYIKGLIVQRDPIVGTEKFRKKYHYTGERNKFSQIHLVRNAFFEPGLNQHNDSISDCLNRMNIAFGSGKPLIISTHRINYIGFIDEEFRTRNLESFKLLLEEMLRQQPDIEFMTSSDLGKSISERG